MTALHRLRTQLAKTLLLQDQTLSAIAEQLGYCDAFHFSKTFKKVEGVSPTIFLKGAAKRSI